MTLFAPQHRVVLTYGRFDLFNQNHSTLLRHLCAMGDELIVGCSTDQLIASDGIPCVQGFDARRAMLERCRYVSRVINYETFDQTYTDIVNYNVSLFVMRDIYQGQFDALRDVTKVLYLSGYGDKCEKPKDAGVAAA